MRNDSNWKSWVEQYGASPVTELRDLLATHEDFARYRGYGVEWMRMCHSIDSSLRDNARDAALAALQASQRMGAFGSEMERAAWASDAAWAVLKLPQGWTSERIAWIVHCIQKAGSKPQTCKPALQVEGAEAVAYPEGDVVGPCVCGSWPGGKCLKCPRTAPPARRPLTDEEIDRVIDVNWSINNHKPTYVAHREFARAIERAHKIGGNDE